MWPIKCRTKLIQSKVDDFDATRLIFSDGVMDFVSEDLDLPLQELLTHVASVPPSPAVDLQSLYAVGVSSPVVYDGDKQPKHQSRKLFQFVAVPSANHILKMESSSSINCTILKSMKVPEPGYEVAFTLITFGSIFQKKLYRVTISDFLVCTCKGFRNPSSKWILYKHLYFILQSHMFCTIDDAFIHCPGWIPNEVGLLMGRMEHAK